jgi:plastocyanin domain-containing protein
MIGGNPFLNPNTSPVNNVQSRTGRGNRSINGPLPTGNNVQLKNSKAAAHIEQAKSILEKGYQGLPDNINFAAKIQEEFAQKQSELQQKYMQQQLDDIEKISNSQILQVDTKTGRISPQTLRR